MYIHLNPDRTKAFAGWGRDFNKWTLAWTNWPVIESTRLVIWPDATSYNLDIASMVQVFGHQAAALRLCSDFLIGIFENANRAEVGQPPKFEAASFHIYDLRG